MSLISHIDVIDTKCHKLDAAILEEASRPLPNFLKITEMKRQKLALKQQRTRLLEQLRKAEPATA